MSLLTTVTLSRKLPEDLHKGGAWLHSPLETLSLGESNKTFCKSMVLFPQWDMYSGSNKDYFTCRVVDPQAQPCSMYFKTNMDTKAI